MEVKQITKDVQIICDWKSTRTGFKHEATVFKNGREVGFAKAIYYNRTWEAYTYQTVMIDAVEKSRLDKKEKVKLIRKLKENSY